MREPAEWPDRVDADLVDQDERALTSRLPVMAADEGHAFSSGASRLGGEKGVESLPSSAPAPVYFQARAAYGGTGEFVVQSVPGLVVQGVFPTLEAAQAYALAMNLWADQRPDPADVRPFFRAPDLRTEPDFAQLEAIFMRGERPERMGL